MNGCLSWSIVVNDAKWQIMTRNGQLYWLFMLTDSAMFWWPTIMNDCQLCIIMPDNLQWVLLMVDTQYCWIPMVVNQLGRRRMLVNWGPRSNHYRGGFTIRVWYVSSSQHMQTSIFVCISLFIITCCAFAVYVPQSPSTADRPPFSIGRTQIPSHTSDSHPIQLI